jgi:hypothetical protein
MTQEFTWQVIVLAVGILILLLAFTSCTPMVIEAPLNDPPPKGKSIEKDQPIKRKA